jgi:hypothetical protein
MADQHPHQGRRQHFHRGRRGHDRRGGGERRPSPQPQNGGGGHESQPEQADVDQIVREIKSRISQRHGIDLSAQQIQELAARRLEAILDPRTVKPGLLDQLRKAAGAPADISPSEPPDAFTFEDHTIYDTHNGLLRFLRKLFNPLLKLFFNPNPIAAALNAQAKVNREAARRESERERTQAEWNALHYTVLQRLVTEVSRVSLEMQSLALRVESLSTRADYAERRIRSMEAMPPPPAVPSRSFDTPAATTGASAPRPGGDSNSSGGSTTSGSGSAAAEGSSEGSRRRRRRRRGRRGPGTGGETATPGAALAATQADVSEGDDDAFDEGPEGDAGDGFETSDAAALPEAVAPDPIAPAPEPATETFASAPAAPEPVVHEPAPFEAAAPPALEEPATAPAVTAPEPAAHPADPPAPPDAPPVTDDPPRT